MKGESCQIRTIVEHSLLTRRQRSAVSQWPVRSLTRCSTVLPARAGSPGIGSGSPKTGGTLTVGIESDAPKASTFTGSTGKLDAAGFCVANAVFDSLFLTPKNGQMPLLPNLGLTIAGSSGSAGAYTVWDVTLRQGVTFHDGSDFNADAVVSNFAAAAANATVGSAINPLIKSCTKTGDYSVQYETKIPFYNFPYILSESQIAYMANPKMFGTWTTGPSGTGPFKYVSWSVGTQSQWTKNNSYSAQGRVGQCPAVPGRHHVQDHCRAVGSSDRPEDRVD